MVVNSVGPRPSHRSETPCRLATSAMEAPAAELVAMSVSIDASPADLHRCAGRCMYRSLALPTDLHHQTEP